MSRGVGGALAVSADDRSKPWFFPAFYSIVEDKSLTPADKIVLFVLAARSDKRGLYWIQRIKLAIQTGFTREGLTKILKRLQKKGFLEINKVRPGDRLPSDQIASRVCFVYQLTKRITAVHNTVEHGSGEHGFGERSTVAPENTTPISGERRSSPLRDLDPEKKIEKKRAPAPDRYQSAKWRIKKLILDIREDKHINPHELRMLIAEAREDGIPLPDVLEETLSRLERHGLIELTSLRKIEWLAWNEPTPLPTLYKRDPAPEGEDDVATLIALHLPKFRT